MVKKTKKRNFCKTAFLLCILAIVLTCSTIVVCAYYMSRVYLYTDEVGGKQLFRTGMELNSFFDEINSGTTTATTSVPEVAEKTPLDIACTDPKLIFQTDGNDDCTVTDTDGNTVALSAVQDGVTYYFTNNTSNLTIKATVKMTTTTTTEGTTTTTTYEDAEYLYNSSAKWGTASNPFLISRINHLQNLYVLQNIGFFTTYYQEDNADGTVTSLGTTESNIPYFLISTSLGTPVTIDGTDMTFEYIGNNEYPFIGYVGGAFVTTDAADTTQTLSTTVNGQTSNQSVIYNLTVKTDDDVTDVGLFGHVGYLGTITETEEGSTFSGAVSTIRNFLLYDVKVKVENKSVWTALIEATAHLFSFSSTESDSLSSVPHETHHIGILAGHVEYATVEYVSVYYSSDDIPAIDVDMTTKSSNDTSANFYSVSCIFGYVVGMNSSQSGGSITIGGINNDDISATSGGGTGTGGGSESGEGRGYVTAKEIFDEYKQSGKIVKATGTVNNEEIVKYGLLLNLSEDGEGNTYLTLTDGTSVTMADDKSYATTSTSYKNFLGQTETTEQKWYNFVVHDIREDTEKSEEYYFYTTINNKLTTVYAAQEEVEVVGISLKFAAKIETDSATNQSTFSYLCSQYVRDRIIAGTQATDRYYFYDGVFTFALSSQADTIEKTWSDGTTDKIVVGQDDDDSWTQDESALPNSVVAFIKPVTDISELQTGKEIFIAYKEGDSYHIVTLAGNSTYTAGDGDNAVYTNKTTLSLASDELTTIIGASLNNGSLTFTPSTAKTTLSTLKTDWAAGDIQVLNLGTVGSGQTVFSLETLKNTYQVKVTTREADATQGWYEDYDYDSDGSTSITSEELATLKANALIDISGNYYTLDSTTGIAHPQTVNDKGELVDSDEYGEGFTFFTFVGYTTVDMTKLKEAVDTNNTTYTSQETDNTGNTVSISNMQTAINARNLKYYDLSGNEVLATAVQSAINTRNGLYYTVDTVDGTGTSNKDAEVDITLVQSAIEAQNNRYYNLGGTDVSPASVLSAIAEHENHYYNTDGTEADYDAIMSAINEINGKYFALGTSNGKDNTPFTLDNAHNLQDAIDAINSKYYWDTSVTATSTATSTSAGTETLNYFKLKSTSETTVDPSTLTKNTTLYYQADGQTPLSSDEILSTWLPTDYGSPIKQEEYKYDQGYWYWEYMIFLGKYKYTYMSQTVDSSGNATYSQAYQTGNISTKPSKYFTSEEVTLPDGNSYTVYTANGFTGRMYNQYAYSEYYEQAIEQRSGTKITLDTVKSNCIHKYYQDYHYVVKLINKDGITYWLDGVSKCDAAPDTTSSGYVSDINKYQLYKKTVTTKTISTGDGFNYPLYTCTAGGTEYKCIYIIRYDLNDVIVETTTGAGVQYTAYSSGSTLSAPTATPLTTIYLNDVNRNLYYSSGNYLGLMVANFRVDGILLESTSGAGGTKGSLVTVVQENSAYKYQYQAEWNLLSTEWDIGQTISEAGITFKIYSSGTQLGIKAKNSTIDGILLETLTGTGTNYSVIMANGSGTITGLKQPVITSPKQTLSVSVSPYTYDMYIAESSDGKTKYLGVRLQKEDIDGILLQTITGTGYSYSLMTSATSKTALSSSPYSTSVRTVTLNVDGVDVSYDLYQCADGKLGVRLENEQIDGILLQTLKGSGYAYSLVNWDTTNSKLVTDATFAKKPGFDSTFTAVSNQEKILTVTDNGVTYKYTVHQAGGKLCVRLENEYIDGIMLQTLTGEGYTYSIINGTTGDVVSGTTLSSAMANDFSANIAKEKTLTVVSGGKTYTFTVYQHNDYLGVRLANEKIDGIMLTSLKGSGTIYTLIDGSGTKVSDLTSTFTSVSTDIDVLKTLTVDGKSYVIYTNNGKLGIKAQNFVVDGIIVQTQTGTGVQYTLIDSDGHSTDLGYNNLTFDEVDGRTVTSTESRTYQVYLSSDNRYCVRVANMKTDGYAEALVVVGSDETNYFFYDSEHNTDDTRITLSGAPKALNGVTTRLSNGTGTYDYNLYVCDGKLGIELIHENNPATNYYTFWHTNADDADDPYTLRILKRAYTFGSSKYGMICSTEEYVADEDNFSSFISCRSTTYNSDCTVILTGDGDGSAYLQYTVSGETRYLAYSTSGKYFNTDDEKSTASKLYLFTMEGTHEASEGEHMVPIAGTQEGSDLSADQYVLFPQNGYDSTDSSTDDYNPANKYAPDTTYTIMSVSQLAELGFKNGSGLTLTNADLSSVFSLGSGVTDVTMINIGSGNTGTTGGADNYVKVPIGTTGEESYIPTGCVAFRVNKTLETNKIRVIVAVPVSEFYYGAMYDTSTLANPSSTELTYAEDYFFCMWKVDEANATDNFSFSTDESYAAFELPRSTPYNPSDSANKGYYSTLDNGGNYDVTGNNVVKKYINVQFEEGGETYRAYLNGEQVLVAYEFDATEEGIYVLGSTQACRIVYFSADSCASAGKDGAVSHKLGTIDYVYDSGDYTVADDGTVTGTAGDKILTVIDTNQSATMSNDYSQYYFASLDYIYTDNDASVTPLQDGDTDKHNSTFPNINNFLIYVRRVATHDDSTGGYATMAWQAKNYVDDASSTQNYDGAYIQMEMYSGVSDATKRRANGVVVRETVSSSGETE